jgi:hypothetical protein
MEWLKMQHVRQIIMGCGQGNVKPVNKRANTRKRVTLKQSHDFGVDVIERESIRGWQVP